VIRQALTFGLVAIALAFPHEAGAQGRGRPKQPRPTAPAGSLPPASAASVTVPDGAVAQASVPTFRQFGSWLDDASSPAAGSGWTGIGIGYWRVPGGSQIDVPILNLAYGVTNRVQLSATVPFYRARYLGSTARGLDDVYVSSKFVAVDPATSDGNVGLAVSPLLEILSTGSTAGGRVQWALPVSAEIRAGAARLYGSAGYFSRGAVFTGAAIEWTAASGTMLTGALTQSLSTSEIDSGAAVATSRNRVDAMFAVAHPLTTAMAGYASVGRSLTSIDEGGTSFAFGAGISIRF
jgi:hypothetical protein